MYRRITLAISAPTHPDGDLISLEIAPDTTVDILKESVQAESSIPKSSQHLYHNGQLLNDNSKTMEQLQIGDGEMLSLHVRAMARSGGAQQARPAAQSSPARAAAQDPETVRLQILGNPTLRAEILRTRPELGGVIDDSARFALAFRQMQEQEHAETLRRQQHIADLNADPFDMDAQLRIEEMIREERVQENLQNAIEHNPEGMHYYTSTYATARNWS